MNEDLISRSRLLRDPYFREDRYPVSHHLRMAIMEQPAVDPLTVFKQIGLVKEAFEMAKAIVDKAPTIEVEPVRHGRWEFKHPNGWACSECGEWGLMIDNRGICKSNYCPNCGAKMDGGSADADSV